MSPTLTTLQLTVRKVVLLMEAKLGFVQAPLVSTVILLRSSFPPM
jgi:hypothetical protein